MSLILKGIDMPHEEINLTITKDGRIYLDNKYHLIAEAVQIPKDHGRLIDGDALIEQCTPPSYCVWMNEIEDAPTILESEEIDEHNIKRD